MRMRLVEQPSSCAASAIPKRTLRPLRLSGRNALAQPLDHLLACLSEIAYLGQDCIWIGHARLH
jgi:hypothetical protein